MSRSRWNRHGQCGAGALARADSDSSQAPAEQALVLWTPKTRPIRSHRRPVHRQRIQIAPQGGARPMPPTAQQLQFDVEKYIRNSKKVDISDIDLSQASQYPVTDDEVRALTYMCDIESHTIVYLRAILNTCAIEDSQTTSFLSCWAYEEY